MRRLGLPLPPSLQSLTPETCSARRQPRPRQHAGRPPRPLRVAPVQPGGASDRGRAGRRHRRSGRAGSRGPSGARTGALSSRPCSRSFDIKRQLTSLTRLCSTSRRSPVSCSRSERCRWRTSSTSSRSRRTSASRRATLRWLSTFSCAPRCVSLTRLERLQRVELTLLPRPAEPSRRAQAGRAREHLEEGLHPGRVRPVHLHTISMSTLTDCFSAARSWASLKSAVGVSDEEMANALRHTAYYATLSAATRAGTSSRSLEPVGVPLLTLVRAQSTSRPTSSSPLRPSRRRRRPRSRLARPVSLRPRSPSSSTTSSRRVAS